MEKNKSNIGINCPECDSDHLYEDETRGEVICGCCGLVVDTIMKDDWRAYASYDDNTQERVGAPSTLMSPDKGLSTQFQDTRRDSQGHYLPVDKQNQFRRLSRMDGRPEQPQLRNLRSALRELKRISSHMDLPDIITEEASRIYRKALNESLIRGHSIDGIMAAAIYISCRRKKIPITYKDIAAIAAVDQKEFGRCVRLLLTRLKLKNPNHTYKTLIFKLGEDLGLTIHTRRRAIEIVEEAKGKGITIGKNPMSIAAASLYIAGIQTGERRTQQQIANIAKTTPVTIRHRFKEIVRALDIEELNVKRGAAAAPVYISDPEVFMKNT